jgi:hypothetical protein
LLQMAELEDWEVAEIKLEGVHLGTQSAPNPEPVFNAPRVDQPAGDVIPEREVPLDDALIAACENPRERMVVLQLEDTILKFVKSSNETSLEFPSGLNSFRRLVVYRLADRFGLQKEQINYDINEKALRLIKSQNICIPRPLMIDYKDPSRTPTGSAATVSQSSSDSAPDAESSSSKKVMLIKRKPADNSASSGKMSSNKPQVTAEDRERAYQEARARIFGDTAGTSDPPSSLASTSSPPPPTATVDGNFHEIAPIAKGPSGTNLSLVAGVATEGNTGNESNMKRVTSGSQISNLSSSQASYQTGGSGKMRAQLRGSEAERYDPDFVRGSNVNSGRYSGNNSPNCSNIRSSNPTTLVASSRGYNTNNAYYANNNTGYMDASSISGLNPHANSWMQHSAANQAYAMPPPPSLVTPSAGYEADQYAGPPYQCQRPSPQLQQQYGYYSPSFPVGSGYDYRTTAGAPSAPMMMTSSAQNTYSQFSNNQYTPYGGSGNRAPPSASSQSEFPALR